MITATQQSFMERGEHKLGPGRSPTTVSALMVYDGTITAYLRRDRACSSLPACPCWYYLRCSSVRVGVLVLELCLKKVFTSTDRATPSYRSLAFWKIGHASPSFPYKGDVLAFTAQPPSRFTPRSVVRSPRRCVVF